MTAYRVEDDLVEDSEPEREAARRAFMSESACHSTFAVNHTCATHARLASPVSIIEISDDSFATGPQSGEQSRSQKSISMIEITSSSISSPLSVQVLNPVPTNPDPPPAIRNDVDENLPSDDELPSLGLGKFSFNSHPRGKGTASRPFSTSAPLTECIPKSTNNPKSISRKMASESNHRFSVDFSDKVLARLLRCIACDIRWTVRKTASQKIAHIQSCSKNKGFTEDTVRQLIRKELGTTPLTSSRKGKEKASSPEAPLTTILTEIVQEAAPKKRNKRRDVVMTVKSLDETRANILDRAQTVFAQSSSTCRAFHSSEHPSHIEVSTGSVPPSTPEFGSSHLARTRGAKQSMFHSPTTSEDHRNAVLLTLDPLDPGLASPLHVLATSDAPNKAMITTTPNKNTFTVPPLIYLSSSSSDATPNSPDSTRDYRSSRFCSPVGVVDRDVDYAEAQDDMYLHYSPPPVSASSDPASLWDIHPISDTPATVAPVSGSKPNVSPTKRRRRPGPKGTDLEPQFDHAWEQQLKDNILADKELHMRILRYEPISFKTFLEYTPTNNVKSNGKTKMALKQFLDKQAVHFYDEETMSRRR